MAEDDTNPTLLRNADVDGLMQQIRAAGSLTPAYAALDQALAEFAATGYPLTAIVPSDTGLGFNLSAINSGKTFWEAYSRLIHRELCRPDGELHSLARRGIEGASGAAVTAIMTTLGLPVAAMVIVIPVTAILLSIGLDAYCASYGAKDNDHSKDT